MDEQGKGPAILDLQWLKSNENYEHADKCFVRVLPDVTIRCKGGHEKKVRHATLFNLMDYFHKKEEDKEFFDRTSHDLDSVEADILELVVRFVETGQVYLRQHEYARFGKAVRLLEPVPTYDVYYEEDEFHHYVEVNLLEYTEKFKKLYIGTGDIKIRVGEDCMNIHSFVASFYSGVLKRKIEIARRSNQSVIFVDDITFDQLKSIRRLIYGRREIQRIENLPDFLKLLKTYEISYIHIAPNATRHPTLTEEQRRAIVRCKKISKTQRRMREIKKLEKEKKEQSSKQRSGKSASTRISSDKSAKQDDDHPQPSTSGVQRKRKAATSQSSTDTSAGKSSDTSSDNDDDKKGPDRQPSTSGVQRKHKVASTQTSGKSPSRKKSSDTSAKKGLRPQLSTGGVQHSREASESEALQWRLTALEFRRTALEFRRTAKQLILKTKPYLIRRVKRKSSDTSSKKDDKKKGSDHQPSTSGVVSTQSWKVLPAEKSSKTSAKKDDDKKGPDHQPSTSGVKRRREAATSQIRRVKRKSTDASSKEGDKKKGPDAQPSTSGVQPRPDPQPSTSGVQRRSEATRNLPPLTAARIAELRRESEYQHDSDSNSSFPKLIIDTSHESGYSPPEADTSPPEADTSPPEKETALPEEETAHPEEETASSEEENLPSEAEISSSE